MNACSNSPHFNVECGFGVFPLLPCRSYNSLFYSLEKGPPKKHPIKKIKNKNKEQNVLYSNLLLVSFGNVKKSSVAGRKMWFPKAGEVEERNFLFG